MINSYIALDLETTGLNPKQDKIIEIGAVRVENGQETGRFHTMLNPHRELEERITELTGIAWDMLKDAPDIGDILEEFLAFCGELPLLGHRIIFDYSFVISLMFSPSGPTNEAFRSHKMPTLLMPE